MKHVLMFIFIFLYLSSDSHQKAKITKRRIIDSNEHYPASNTICTKIYIVNDITNIQVEYASNGWQVIDSLVFTKESNTIYIKYYRPIYDENTFAIKTYELMRKEWKKEYKLKAPINIAIDKYCLCKQYLMDLQFLLERNPEQSMNNWRFREAIIPSLLHQYGIPITEYLDSFNFNIDSSLIKNDIFYFRNYTLTRTYHYGNNVLSEVLIMVVSKKRPSFLYYRESFVVEKFNTDETNIPR
jgi:hypothetical protein